uniref:Potassium channel domain-containing protein n=1 Tax=Strongyloides stercoralis TaxID=6248 RepID=A0A0K0E5E6_STRER
MDEQFREIEGLLECTDHVQTRSFKKYAKIILPHVVLVLTVCLYAIIGSLIFYHFEAPHEENLKITGVKHIDNLRKDLIQTMWSFKTDNTHSFLNTKTIQNFYINMERKLETFNSDVFKAFKDQYVRYDNVKVSSNYTNLQNSRSRKYRKANSKSDKSGQLWTHSSSLFFAATTMATIGYGNIVPVTPQGRIACVIFALFGAPLAIITIGDLGKFLSECTIWLYKNIIKVRKTLSLYYARWSNIRKGVTTEVDETVSTHKSVSRSNIDWDDLDKTEVPVLLVFAILLLYIALGGILFAILESWTYMDAFYYCFVSLTTIGFGDFVPERHEYIVIMLIYLFVGLAVTTMCIDLVGIQYIQKIHYFGRKFRGTDILQLLKRKRMIERRIALGQGEEILQMCLTHMAKEQIQAQIPMKSMVSYVKPDLPKKFANTSFLSSHNSIVSSFSNNSKKASLKSDIAIISETNHFKIASSCSIPTIFTGSLPESPYTISSASRRSMMYERFENRENSWIESGPDISFHCSISTSPSVYEREFQFNNRHSPSPSIESFKFSFLPDPIPSPDIKKISDSVKKMRRSLSCSGIIEHIYSTKSSKTSLDTQSSLSTTGLHCMINWEQPITTAEGKSLEIIYYSPVKSLEDLEEPETHKILEKKNTEVWKEANISDISEPSHIIFPPLPDAIELTPSIYSDDFELELNTIVEQVSPEPPLSSYVSIDEESSNFFGDDSSSSSNSPAFDIDLGAFELVNSGMTAESLLNQEEPVIYHKDMPVHSVHHDTVQTEAALENLMNAPKSMLSSVVPPTMVADNYCFVVDGDKVKFGDIMGDDQWWRHTSRPTKYFYSDDMKKFTRVNCITAKGKIISARLAVSSSSHSAPNSATLMISSSTSSTLNAGGSGSIQSSTTPRPSFSISARSTGGGLSSRGEKVSLNNVYKVIRFYSFWKTCTSFHRICTMIDKVTDTNQGGSSPGFKRRLFVQYLWRNAKPSDKIRVQKEFDPRRQRLLRFVTAENAQKKRSSVVRNEKSEHPFSRSSSVMKRNF